MRPRLRTEPGPRIAGQDRPLELVRVRGAQRHPGAPSGELRNRSRRRRGRGRRRSNRPPIEPPRFSLWRWLTGLFRPAPAARPARPTAALLTEQESRVIAEFAQRYSITFRDPNLLKLALTHRSYLSVTGQGPRESNERLEFLGDSVLGLVTSENLYRAHPNEHEGQLTKTKSLLVSKAILSRRALAMGLGRFVLMSHSEIESGGRQRLSILADAFESVIGAIYLDQGFETAREFIVRWLLRDAGAIVSDKRHTNYKSHLQEYVQSTFRTHPVYRIRSEMGPDHSKMFNVDVIVGRRVLGSGKGHNKKEAEQAAARNALEQVETKPRGDRPERDRDRARGAAAPAAGSAVGTGEEEGGEARTRRGRRGGRLRRGRGETEGAGYAAAEREAAPVSEAGRPSERAVETPEVAPARSAEPPPAAVAAPPLASWWREPGPGRGPAGGDHDLEEVGRPEGPLEERGAAPYSLGTPPTPAAGTGGRAVDSFYHRPRIEAAKPAPETTGSRFGVEPGDEPEEAETPGGAPSQEDRPEELPDRGGAGNRTGPPGPPPAFGRRPGRGRR
jgi:ribonuclease-3